MKYRWLIIQEDYSVTGTNNEDVAMAAASDLPVIDTCYIDGDGKECTIDLSMIVQVGPDAESQVPEETGYTLA